VRRTLPTRGRRTVGPWCFVDHLGPTTFAPGSGVAGPPHPHLGLQTVTWVFDGAVLHRDSLGSEQLVRPRQLNLMTAGAGIAHSEEDPDGRADRLHGMQLWVAQPEATRWAAPTFEHHADLPRAAIGNGTATVLVGSFAGVASPARRDTNHVGVELDVRPGTSVLPLEPADEDVVMWWNFVARSREELSDAYRGWVQGDGRFGRVPSSLERVAVDPPPWLRSS
jgi:hypothetical protein